MTLPTRPIARQPEGTPVGGQFATTTKSEAHGVSLGPVDPSPAQIGDAVEVLKKRRDGSWPAAAARHDEDEGAWAASNAAVAAREMFPDADAIEYGVDKDGRLSGLEVVKDGRLIGEIWRTTDGKMAGRDWLADRVGSHLDGRDLDDMAGQGAEVTDDVYSGEVGPKTVRIGIDDAIHKAHARIGGTESTGHFRTERADQALRKRSEDARKAAEADYRQDETAWTASQVAVNTRDVYPTADEIGYTVDGSGQIGEIEFLAKGRPVGYLSLNEDRTFKSSGKSTQLNGSVFTPLERTSLDEMERQGATVTDDLEVDEGAGKLVRFRFDDAIMKAASRAQE